MTTTPPSSIPYAADYAARFAACKVRPERLARVDALITQMLGMRPPYDAVAKATGVPWYWIAAVHNLESSLSFTRHLHNGDPLTARTVHVPAGRPVTGAPPFTWEASAADALHGHGLDRWRDWSVAGLLYKLEAFNGFGYRHLPTPIPSPYLWAASDQYTVGKYAADGRYDPHLVSAQIGGGTLLKRMHERGRIVISGI